MPSCGGIDVRLPVWNEALSVGDLRIDEEHRYFFSQLRELLVCTETGPLSEVRSAVATLIAELITHFDHEEAVFGETAYPDASSHAVEHRILLHMAQEVSGEVSRSSNLCYLRLSVEQMAQVIIQHLQGSDLCFKPYIGTVI